MSDLSNIPDQQEATLRHFERNLQAPQRINRFKARAERRAAGLMAMESDQYHIAPTIWAAETEAHDLDSYGECPCKPSVLTVEREDGSTGYLYHHNFFDGRPLKS